ncbi:TPA: hypothetical protein PVK15_002117, partial [Acinetobacter baumannii]|nr:hypothetical protein [Acinetobacter baumannii]HDK8947861.1 hypothetical protein [Acinetobacter baumannii]
MRIVAFISLIIDLAGGKQPMVDLVDDNNKVALIYTGEIYNF